MNLKKIRLGDQNDEYSSIITKDLDKINHINKYNQKDNVNIKNYLLGIIIFIISFTISTYFMTSFKLATLRRQANYTRIQEISASQTEFSGKKEYIRQNKLNKAIINYYRQRVKNSTSQISALKLVRAKQFLRNFTQEIDPVYYKQEQLMFKSDYNVNVYQQKPICVLVTTFNNVQGNRYAKNINSILQQKYINYRVIIIDDASQDNTSSAIKSHIQNNSIYKQGRIKIQRNPTRKMLIHNILDAGYNYCLPNQIFMVIDGEDYLLGRLVFKLINFGFSDPDNWVVYSNFLSANGRVGYSRKYPMEVIRDNEFRNVLFVVSHLRAFYTKLLLLIDEQDFLDSNGKIYNAASDVAILMPILEMSRHHLYYLREISYYYNSNNYEKYREKQQINNEMDIRSKKRYYQLKELFRQNNNDTSNLM